MGLSFDSQVDSKKYFSISNIDRKVMAEIGLNMKVSELKKRARNSPYYTTIMTGSISNPKQCRMTKVYRYSDFLNNGGNHAN